MKEFLISFALNLFGNIMIAIFWYRAGKLDGIGDNANQVTKSLDYLLTEITSKYDEALKRMKKK